MKPVTQEHPMGCAVACVASATGLSYKKAHLLFKNKRHAAGRGYYCPEIIAALRRKNIGKNYAFSKVNQKTRFSAGDIVFIARSKKYPCGHYFLKTGNGWMNSWTNYPHIMLAKAGFEKRLPGNAQWIVHELRKKASPRLAFQA